MPSRYEDYEAELMQTTKYNGQRQYGYRKSSDSSSYYGSITTSGPTSTSTTRSSHSSNMAYNTHNATSAMQKPQVSHRQRLSQTLNNTNPFLHGTKSNQSATQGIQKNHSAHGTVTPTASVQEWAHQVHIQQRRRYDWCSECYPKSEPLQVPSEKAVRRVRIQEPTHCYE